MRAVLAVLIGRLVRFCIRLVRPGGGSSVPGRITAAIAPDLLYTALEILPLGVAVVSGSAGKSSTTKFLVDIARAHGLKVFTNESTSNIKQGFYSSILQFGTISGRIRADIAILEWDEGHGALLSQRIKPRLAILTNVLSDQLDRFVDPDFVIEKLRTIATNSQTVIANGNDKNLTQFLVHHPSSLFFGLAENLRNSKSAPIYALNFDIDPSPELSAEIYAIDEEIKVEMLGERLSLAPTGLGYSMALNTLAAVFGASRLLQNFSLEKTKEVLAAGKRVFARDEVVELSGQKVRLLLVQNPTSFQINLDLLEEQPENLMILVGTDIHDPSWLWTVDFSGLSRVEIIGGFNAHELALRLTIQGVSVGRVITDVPEATEAFLALPGQGKTVMFSADGMRRMRRYTRLAK